MSNLNAFLHPVNTVDKQEVIVSDRFCDENGKPAPFVIRPITQEENEKLIRLSTRRVNVRGQKVERLDNGEYGRRVVVAATVTPDFRSEEMCKAYGTMDPLEVPGKMLLVGEFNRLSDAILALSGLDDDPEELAKN
jgi:hypothetical protein